MQAKAHCAEGEHAASREVFRTVCRLAFASPLGCNGAGDGWTRAARGLAQCAGGRASGCRTDTAAALSSQATATPWPLQTNAWIGSQPANTPKHFWKWHPSMGHRSPESQASPFQSPAARRQRDMVPVVVPFGSIVRDRTSRASDISESAPLGEPHRR